MKAAFYILFAAVFTSGTSLALGLILFRTLSLRLKQVERWLLAYITGSALLSALVLVLCSLHLALKGVFLALGLLAIALAVRFGSRLPPAEPLPPLSRRWKTVVAVVFGVFSVLYFFHAMAPEMSPDGSTYHLPFAAAYYRAHGFVRIPWNLYANLSQGLEMLFLFAYAFGRYSAAALIHFSFLAALPWLMMSYGRRFGLAAAGIAGGLFFYVSPVVGMDGSVAYVDVGLAAVSFALFYLLQIWDAERQPQLLIPIGILAGFGVAIKYTAVFAVPYAVGFIAWKLWRRRQPVWRPAALVAGLALVFIVPWLVKNRMWVGNPVAPFANRLFPNPYVHVSFEKDFRDYQRDYGLASYKQVPFELTLGGTALCGLFGPLFLLTPLALFSLRRPAGRQLLLAGAIFALPYAGNIGTRFLIPAAPFLSIALALALMNWEWILIALVLAHAVLSWPDVLKLYCSTNAWRLDKILAKQALRIEPEGSYLSRKFPGYLVDEVIEHNLPPTGQVFSFSQIAEAYTSRKILVRYLCAGNEVLGDMLWTPLIKDFQPSRLVDFHFSRRPLRKVRAVTTHSDKDLMWSVSELRVFDQGVELSRDSSWRLTADPNPWDVQLAFDNSAVTRWRSWEHIRPGMFIELDFQGVKSADAVRLEMPPDWSQPGVQLEGMDGSGQWKTISEKPTITDQPLTTSLRQEATGEFKARGIRYLLIGYDDIGSEDFQQHSQHWGIRLLADRGYMRLYYIE